ncbi:hypothetical protein DMENIID0001_125340 [Sergentomyia squamirostris]
MGKLILQLNDDCLLEIFSYFDLLQITRLRFVCTRFNEVAENAYRCCRILDCVELTKKRKMTGKKLEEIASKVGKFVHTLKISYSPQYSPRRYNNFASRYGVESSRYNPWYRDYSDEDEDQYEFSYMFRKLKRSYKTYDNFSDKDISSTESEEESEEESEAQAQARFEAEAKAKVQKENEEKCRFIKIFEYCVSLKHLHTIGKVTEVFVEETQKTFLRETIINLETLQMESAEVDSEIGIYILAAEHLESLILTSCYITGTWLAQLHNLKELNVGGSDVIELSSVFERFCRTNPTLQKLNVYKAEFFDNALLGVATRCLKNLMHLNIGQDSYNYRYEPLLDLPNLTHLTIRYATTEVHTLLKALAAQNRLEYLNLSIKSSSSKRIQKALTAFETLKVLKIHYCRDMDDEFLQNLPKSSVLEEIYVPWTKVTDSGVNRLISKNSALRYIDVTNCSSISESLVHALKRHTHNPPLTIAAYGTNIRAGYKRSDLEIRVSNERFLYYKSGKQNYDY